MIINKISIENFQSYFECQTLDFLPGLNLIIGNGGRGKSKLFNAFYWSLFGNIYITDIGWVDTDLLSLTSKNNMGKHEFINKRALSLAKKNDYVRASVQIELTNFENGKNVDYLIERFVVGKKINEDSWDTETAWQIVPNELKVSYETNTGTRIDEGSLAELKIEDLFPSGIRNYIWFQGESLDSLIDFRKKETLKAAVKHISYYPLYEKLSQIITISTEKITSQERKKTAFLNKNNVGVQKLIKTIENNKIHLEKNRATRNELENQIIELSSIMQKDEKKLEGLADFTGIVKDYDNCELEMANINAQIEKLDDYQRRELPQVWVMRGISTLIEESKQIIHSHTSQQDTLPEKRYLDNPGRSKLEEIIEKELCYICGSVVLPNSMAYETIVKRMKEQEEYFKELEEYTNSLSFNKKFERFIGSISDFPDNLSVSLNAIDKNFQKSENEIEKLIQNRKILSEKKKILDDKISEIKNKFHIDPQKQAGTANIISSGLKATRSNIERLNRKLEIEKSSIANYEAENRRCEKELEKFNSTTPISSRIPETEWKNISLFLKDVCEKVQERARKELLQKIQSRSNEFYEKFTQHDFGYRGSIFINEDYSIAFDSGLNTSHEDRKKMSIINAMLSLNQDALGTFYPFISDAPTSNFDLETTQSYLMGIKDMFAQSIIITKDVDREKDHFKELKFDEKVSRIYLLETEFFDEGNPNPAIHEVASKVIKLK